MSNEITTTVKVMHRKDGLINLYLHHPYEGWGIYKESRNINKQLINWMRREFPTMLNEFRQFPTSWYNSNYGYIDGYYRDHHFCAYGLTKSEYMRLKLSWVMTKEVQLHSKKRTSSKTGRVKFLNVPGKQYFDIFYTKPSSDCVKRFKDPKFKQKALKIT